MKYIVTKQTGGLNDGLEEIFVFPRSVHHDCMAESISYMKNQSHGGWYRVCREPISAGFIVGGKCVGVSESLSLKSRPEEDTALLSL